MRARLFVVTSVAVAAVLGAAGAAHAHPNGPGDISQKPTTSTTAPPKGPDDLAQPTTTTTAPPQPQPKGPGDLANPTSDPVVDPTPTTTKPVVEQAPQLIADDDTATEPIAIPTPIAAPDASHESSNLPTIVIVLVAGLVGALLALFAGRFRRDDDEHANRV